METKNHIIYIVEDSKIIAKILKKVISTLPETDVKYFYTGESMLEDFNLRVPNMIFLDYYLYTDGRKIIDNKPIMNGEMVLAEIKKNHPNIPVVLLTGMQDKDKIEKLKAAGFCCVIHKEEDDIYTAVLNCIEKHLFISK